MQRSILPCFFVEICFVKTRFGSHGGETDIEKDVPKYISLFSEGKMDLKQLITNRFKLQDINKAFELLLNSKIKGRAIIEL